VAHERPARSLLAWALIALTWPAAASASAAAFSMAELPADRPQSPTAPLDLVVNQGTPRSVRAVLRDGDVLVSAEDLAAAGLRGFRGTSELVDGTVLVSLASLAPELRYELDEQALALRLTAGPALLGTASLDLRPTLRPPGLEPRGDPSGFFNYSVQLRSDQRTTTSGFAEAGASQDGRLLYSSGQLLQDGAVVRGLTSLTLDDAPSLRRLVVGDAFAGSGGLGGGVLLGGLSLAREYRLDPYFIRSPLPRISGFTSTPSTLDVYVNGVLTRQIPLPPGGYDVTNLPVTAGSGNVKTVLRDAFGRTEVLDWRYYYTSGLLAEGLSDYGYALGFRREAYGHTSFDYGRPLFVGRHRWGVHDALTLGGRLDAAEDLVSAGPSATIGLPVGSLDLEAAGSIQAGKAGAAASAGYSYVSRRLGAGALLRVLGDRYGHASLRARDDRPRVQSTLFAGAPITHRVSVGMDYSVSNMRDVGLADVLSARTDLLLVQGLTLGVTGSRTRVPGRAPALDVFATLSWAFAPLSVADVSTRAGDGGRGLSAGAQRGLPVGTGYGYRARAGSGPNGDETTGVLQAQWDYGRYEVEYDRMAAYGAVRDVGTASVSGGAVFAGDRLFLSRPVQEGYGVIRVGVPGVRGFAEGQEIGRTDDRGDLLVPSLLPYYGNRLAIADRDVPVEYTVGPTELLAAPTYRGGVVTRFAVKVLRVVQGELVVPADGRDVPPAYGELTGSAAGASFSSPVGGDGRFYLESLPAGSHSAEVEWNGGRCAATILVPESPQVVDLGTVRCLPVLLAKAAVAPAGPAATREPPGAPRVDPLPAVPPAAERVAELRRRVEAAEQPPAKTAGAAESPPAPVPAALPATTSGAAKRTVASVAAPPRTPTAPRVGLGPHTTRCPSCTVCSLAAIDRAVASRYTMSCVRDLALMDPGLSRPEAARACIATADYHELCAECAEVRKTRSCPTWADESRRRGGGARKRATRR
jgi:outer membrane usher protein